jgi:hypothetical protein
MTVRREDNMGTAKSRGDGRKRVNQPVVSVDDAGATYSGEWVLMKVTDFDENKNPARGYILAHSPSRSRITKAFGREPLNSLDPTSADHRPYYVFKAYPNAHTATRLDDLLARLAHEGVEDVPRLW